jgi:hypothetical protein
MEIPNIFGLPAHPLIVHATVVMVPLAAFAVLLHAFVPAARARLGLVTPLAALVAVGLVPLSTSSGERFEEQVGHSPLIERHSELADGLLPWVIGLLVVAVLLTVRDRLGRREPDPAARLTERPVDAGTLVRDGGRHVATATRTETAVRTAGGARRALGLVLRPAVIGLLAVVAVAGTTQQVVRIGHSGAEAAWHGVTSGSNADENR